MGSNFKPNKQHIAAMHEAANKLEKVLKGFAESIKGYKGIELLVSTPGIVRTPNPLNVDWQPMYSQLAQECELQLKITIKESMLRRAEKKTYARIKLIQLPACCGVCVMNGIELHSDIRDSGIGKAFTRMAESFAKVLNYSYIMCTTHKVNGPAIGVLECLGYVELDSGFANMRTKNSIRMFGKNINPDGKNLTDGYLCDKRGL